VPNVCFGLLDRVMARCRFREKEHELGILDSGDSDYFVLWMIMLKFQYLGITQLTRIDCRRKGGNSRYPKMVLGQLIIHININCHK
jgi:hypothetical protein